MGANSDLATKFFVLEDEFGDIAFAIIAYIYGSDKKPIEYSKVMKSLGGKEFITAAKNETFASLKNLLEKIEPNTGWVVEFMSDKHSPASQFQKIPLSLN